MAYPTYPFTEASIKANAPDKHGNYALIEGSEVINIGRAAGDGVTIRSRLLSHLRGQEGPCTKRATHFRFEANSRPNSRELELLDQYRRSHGRLPRCNERRG